MPGPGGPESLAAVGHANGIEFAGPPVGVSDPLESAQVLEQGVEG